MYNIRTVAIPVHNKLKAKCRNLKEIIPQGQCLCCLCSVLNSKIFSCIFLNSALINIRRLVASFASSPATTMLLITFGGSLKIFVFSFRLPDTFFVAHQRKRKPWKVSSKLNLKQANLLNFIYHLFIFSAYALLIILDTLNCGVLST